VNPAEMVIAIIAIVMVARIIMHKQRLTVQAQPPAEAADTMRLKDEVRQLKERVQVLERVITDDRKSIDLDREIERLRDR
jgi:uncharacterized protein YlxW (UPF0749 family)